MSRIVIWVVLATMFGAVFAPSLWAEEERITARAFEIRHRSVADVADLVSGVLSADGSMTLKPKLKTLVVEDRVSILLKVADLIESFDLAPRRVEVTLSLFMGTRQRPDGALKLKPGAADSFSKEVRGVIDSLGDFTQWTEYQPLGSRSIQGVEGEPVIADVAENYRVKFRVGSVSETRSLVRFDRFTLQRVARDSGGIERRPRSYEDLYTAAMVVDSGKLTLVVAASAPDSAQALFLALQADPR